MWHSLILAFIAVCSLPAIGADACAIPKSPTESQEFFVSGVLKKNEDAITVKLVHSTEIATSEQEALVIFVKKVRVEYPNYTMADALVSSVEKNTSKPCVSAAVGMSI